MARKTLLVFGCTAVTPWGRDQMAKLSRQARRRGVTLVGADSAANLSAARPEELAAVDDVVSLDVRDPGACRAWAEGVRGVDAVFTFHELSVLAAAVVARELGIRGNDPEAVRGIRTKDLCRGKLRAAGFTQPHTGLCRDRGDAEAFMRSTIGPWIVKPRDGLASSGVSLVRDRAGLTAALDRLDDLATSLAKFAHSAPASEGPRPPFLIETFVSGEEYSAEGVLLAGRPHVVSITSKTINEDFIEIGHRTPSGLAGTTAAEAAALVSKAIQVAGIRHGVFHVEFWVGPRGIVLGEVHARPGGDYIHLLVEHSCPGLELYGLAVDDLLGWPSARIPAQTRAAGADFLLLPPGRLRAVHGWPEISHDPRTVAADLLVAPGDRIDPVSDSLDRHGVIVAGAGYPSDVDEALVELAARLSTDIDDSAERAA